MAVRDMSPTAWLAPGTAQIGLSVTLSDKGFLPLILDQWINNYSPCYDGYVNLASGWQTLASLIPSLLSNPVDTDTAIRTIIVIPPRGNTQTIQLKGVTGDTGIPVHANGFAAITMPLAASLTWGITAGAAISGVRVIVA